MLYLLGQVWILLLIAFISGWIAHWLLCCRSKNTQAKSVEVSSELQLDSQPQKVIVNDG